MATPEITIEADGLYSTRPARSTSLRVLLSIAALITIFASVYYTHDGFKAFLVVAAPCISLAPTALSLYRQARQRHWPRLELLDGNALKFHPASGAMSSQGSATVALNDLPHLIVEGPQGNRVYRFRFDSSGMPEIERKIKPQWDAELDAAAERWLLQLNERGALKSLHIRAGEASNKASTANDLSSLGSL